MTLELWIFMEI